MKIRLYRSTVSILVALGISLILMPLAAAQDLAYDKRFDMIDELQEFGRKDTPLQSFNEANIYLKTIELLSIEPEARMVQSIDKAIMCTDGSQGFNVRPELKPCIAETVFALMSAQASGPAIDSQRLSKCVSWLGSLQQRTGGFGDPGSLKPSIKSTSLAILGLTGIDMADAIDARTIKWLAGRQTRNGGFRDSQDDENVETAQLAIMALDKCQAMDMIRKDRAVRFILKLQEEDGSFGIDAGSQSGSLKGTYHAVLALRELDSLGELDKGTIKRYVESLNRKGGFAPIQQAPKADFISTFYVLSILESISVDEPSQVLAQITEHGALAGPDTQASVTSQRGDADKTGWKGIALALLAVFLLAVAIAWRSLSSKASS